MGYSRSINRIGVFLLLAIVFFAANPGAFAQSDSYPKQLYGIGESEKFPLAFEYFYRGEIFTYNPEQTHLSIAYNRPVAGAEVAFTVYIVEVALGDDPQNHLSNYYRRSVSAIEEAHPVLQTLEDGTVTIAQSSGPHEGLMSSYEYEMNFAGYLQKVHSELYVFAAERRLVKIRVTYPKDQHDLLSPEVRRLMEGLVWSDR